MDTPSNTPSTPNPSSGADAQKKYIRTFAGDMDILKKGGMPDLKPLKPKPVAPAPEKAPAPAPKLPPPPPSLAPPPPPLLPKPPALEFQKPEPVQASPLQTYKSDFSQRMQDTHASAATVLAAEQDAGKGNPSVTKPPSRGGLISIIAGVLLLVIGGTGVYIAYTRYMTNTQPVAVAPVVPLVSIFVDEREKIASTTPEGMLAAIEESVGRTLAPGAIRLLYIDASTTPMSVFTALDLPAPDILLRNIDNSKSVAGVVNADSGQSPFFILSVSSYGDTFAGMLAWEPRMPDTLRALFPAYPAEVVATTTKKGGKTAPSPAFAVFFHDEVVSNHDVRIYRDAQGRSVMVYGYWNQTTLVIARDPSAFSEILGRLATSRAGQ